MQQAITTDQNRSTVPRTHQREHQDEAFADLMELAIQLCEASSATLRLVDPLGQWSAECWQTPPTTMVHDQSLLEATLREKDILVVEQASSEGESFSVGVPVMANDQRVLGVLALASKEPRDLSPAQEKSLRAIARQVVVVLTDASERRLAEESERVNNERFQLVARATNDAVWDWKIGTNSMWWNEGYLTLFGYEGDHLDVPIESWSNKIHPEDFDRVVRSMHTQIEGGGSTWSDEYRFLCQNGEYAYVFDRGHIIRDSEGKAVRMVGAMQDLTDRKQAEEAQRDTQARYRSLFEYAPDGILIVGPQDSYIDANDSMCQLLGYTREEILGLQTWDIMLGKDLPLLQPTMDEIRGGADYKEEWNLRRKDGSAVATDVMATVMPDGNILVMIRDVTEKRQLQAQYLQAQKMEAIGRLAGGVAHDFNNLLTVILGFSELLLEDLEAQDLSRPSIVEIQRAGESAAALTRQLLAFSRKEIVAPQLLDLNAVIVAMRMILERLLGEHIEVVLDLEDEPALINMDRGQIDQVLLNLAVNARDAMPKGGTLTIGVTSVERSDEEESTEDFAEGGCWVCLTVTDTGAGIDKDTITRLFEPFFTTKAVGQGTGLGLATVHGIVSGCGGRVTVSSEVGQGASFQVLLPGSTLDALRPEAPRARIEGPSKAHTVLVVDDAEGVRKLVGRLLEQQGFKVLLASGLEEAVAISDSSPEIDVLLTDVVMPGISGPELAALLGERWPKLKVVYMSGHNEEAVLQRGILNDEVAFLQKPFDSSTLMAKIREQFPR